MQNQSKCTNEEGCPYNLQLNTLDIEGPSTTYFSKYIRKYAQKIQYNVTTREQKTAGTKWDVFQTGNVNEIQCLTIWNLSYVSKIKK